MQHASEANLALYGTGDLAWWRCQWIGLHVARCAECRRRADEYRADRERLRSLADELPGVRWERLAAEMAANIRVGLAAGECVAPRAPKHTIPTGWRVAGAIGGFCALLVLAWWLNMPPAQTASLGRAMKAIVNGPQWQARRALGLDDALTLVQASAEGVELRENGGALTLSQRGVRPVSVTLNTQGSARARYVDSDTGQVTITSVYAQ
ncbi:MAG TPA: hypothetical protein VGR73_06635 [Bryobacteraceae bacterium]|nr:hypothetical protein [Bryobacteraceae bacterium]